ncbi:MAG: ribonuclease R [Mycoplasmataceae bacterium]|nr:ribonuclease R [Mycoplasmataceae bacterium]
MFNKDFLYKILNEKGQVEFRELAKKMKVPIKQNREFSKFLFSLIKKGELFQTKSRRYFIPNYKGESTGIIRLTPRGFGFIDINDNESIFIPASNVNGAMDGDEVIAKYFEDFKDKSKLQGIIIEIKTRNVSTFVGTVKKFNESFGIEPFNTKINGIFRFEDISGLKVNQEVKVQIIDFGKTITIRTLKILGQHGDASIDIQVAIEDANILSEFHEETILESKKIPDKIGEVSSDRIDLRNEIIFTIDGDDTKDFDDAISIERSGDEIILSVHIADVTNYILENNPIDREARTRGTSIYLVDRVIPMLPKSLSNGICSLNPNVDRMTITAKMTIDKDGNNKGFEIFPSVINSKYRLTYKEVNNFYEGSDIWNDKELTKSLNLSFELSKIIRKYKLEEGYIDFEIEEAKIIVDNNGKTIDIKSRDRSYSEILIEDFMVRANESVAKFISDKKLPFIYRIHGKPESEKIIALENVVKLLGINAKLKQSPTPLEFANSIKIIKENRFDDFMKIMMLRTMTKAEYSKNNIGHFGLASKFYTHFTSPIRRYPDLMVHRMIREYIFNKNENLAEHFEEILPAISKASSESEQTAVALERKVADIKKAEFYEKFIGKPFDGTIVSVMKFGFFVEFPNKAGGLVHLSTLIDGEYKISSTGLSIRSKHREFKVGDKINVTIFSTNKKEAKIDLIVTDMKDLIKQESLSNNKNNRR